MYPTERKAKPLDLTEAEIQSEIAEALGGGPELAPWAQRTLSIAGNVFVVIIGLAALAVVLVTLLAGAAWVMSETVR